MVTTPLAASRRPDLSGLPVLTLVALLVVAAGMRLLNLESYTGKFDEAIRAEQLLLMEAGYRPVREIFTAQGPLSLDIFWPVYMLFGRSLYALRLTAVLFSLAGIAALWWVGRLGSGKLGAFLVAGFIVLSPLYLKNSRLALVEIPALATATLAVGCALMYSQSGSRRALLASALLIAAAVSIKPMALPAAAAAAIIVLLSPSRSGRDLALFGLVCLAVGLGICLLYGLNALLDQVLQYRLAAHRNSGWTLRENLSIARMELVDESVAFYGLAVVAGFLAALRRPRIVLPLLAWLLLSALLLALYSPLQFKHVVILVPPLALLAGLGLADAFRPGKIVTGSGRSLLLVLRVAAFGLLAYYFLTLGHLTDSYRAVLSGVAETTPELYDDEAAIVEKISQPDDFILVDDPFLAYRTRRLVPPGLVDPSSYRVRSGALSAQAAIADLDRFNVRLLFLFSDGLRELRRFAEHVDLHYRVVKIYERPNAKDRALYLREDTDFARAEELLADAREHLVGAEIGGQLRLVGYNLEREELRPGSTTTLTLHWQSVAPISVDWHVLSILRDARGREVLQTERNLGGGSEGTSAWPSGRWVLRSHLLNIRPGTPPGDYTLSVALYDSRSRTSPPVTAGATSDSVANEVQLGAIRVRDRS